MRPYTGVVHALIAKTKTELNPANSGQKQESAQQSFNLADKRALEKLHAVCDMWQYIFHTTLIQRITLISMPESNLLKAQKNTTAIYPRHSESAPYNIVVILGPTASGKTRLAVDSAVRLGGEIISADSRQVYRGMDIGTGKDLEEYGDMPHHLIDIVDPGYEFNVFEFQQRFYAAFEDIRMRERLPVLCGGTGLYLEAVLNAYHMVEAPPDPELRARLERLTHTELQNELLRLKPEQHNSTDLAERERLIRAIEIAAAQQQEPPLPHPRTYIRWCSGCSGHARCYVNVSESAFTSAWSRGWWRRLSACIKRVHTGRPWSSMALNTALSRNICKGAQLQRHGAETGERDLQVRQTPGDLVPAHGEAWHHHPLA